MPKLIVSTIASGDTRPYVGAKDVTMTYSVVDIAGVNAISAQILANAAGAIVGMAQATVPPGVEGRPLVAATMFGVTTPGRHRARASGWKGSATRCSSSTPPAPAASPSRR